jgi:CDP-4-dehydro-6-deoxyglucose reductase
VLSTLQAIGQSIFLWLDRRFNAVFGDQLNPFYYLGAISYFLLWLVIGTGLYLYAFFETGVAGAYDSVQALTHGQWWLGGVLRSVHRYASDGLVLTMLLHLVRHFTFDRYRGFRWFSWVSGVMLLWLVFASGINGYMLPWDRLAQYVVTRTTEWIDVLPVVGGSMTRNFISNANVSDRLFSLLAFMHIGLPLAVMAVLWVHTQRVPGAKTSPPRPLAVGIVAMLVLLALVNPAISQDRVDMSTLPAVVNFDWFYLAMYPILDRWGPAYTWLLLGAGSGLLVLLPWLPPIRKSQTRGWAMAVHPDERIVDVRSGESLLDAGLREGLPMPFECRNGGCGVCKATVLAGQIHMQAYQESALTPAERAAGKTLLCCAEPLSDVEIVYIPVDNPKALPIQQRVARVVGLEHLSYDVMKLSLRLDGGGNLVFHAGQYINIVLDNGERRSFSFATAPHTTEAIELQVRLVPGGRFTTQVFEQMKVGDTLRFEGPLGTFTLREDSTKPIVFVAGSTGFAPVKSMVEHAFHVGLKRQMILYWGVKSLRDLYLHELAAQWASEHDNFTYVPVLSSPAPEDAWMGRTGLVHEAILADFPDLSRHQVYACGSVQMVQAARPAFEAHGIASEDCFSDAFHLAPQRPMKHDDADMVKLGGSHG